MNKLAGLIEIMPLLLFIIGLVLISVGVFFFNLILGFIITGFLTILLAWLVAPRGN